MVNLKLALRVLARTPFVTTIAILSLGLGLGANAAIFSLYSQLILKTLDVPNASQLVNLSAPGPKSGSVSCSMAGPCDDVLSYPMFRDLEQKQTTLAGLAAHRNFSASVAYKGTPTAADGLQISGSYFRVLGLAPAAGRLINEDDDRAPGASTVVVLSHRYWITELGANPAVVNETLSVNGQPMTIIGIAPEGFDGTTIGRRAQVFVPITMAEVMEPNRKVFENRRAYWLYSFGRLKPGTTIAQAAPALNQLYHGLINEVDAPLQKGMSAPTLARFKAKTLELSPGQSGQSSIPSEASAPLMLLLGVTLVVLLSACANIANLLLAKAVGRAGEMAVRLSIGAARRQLIGQLLGESVLLAAGGGLLGILIGKWTLTLLFSMMPSDVTAVITPQLDARALVLLGAATIGTGLLFGLFPALHSSRPNLALALKGQAGQPGGARSARRFRAALAVTQITLSMALLAVAGLFVKSLINVHHVDLGMRTAGVVTFGIAPGLNGYAPERSKQVLEAVEDALARVPGVSRSSGGMVPVLVGDNWTSSVRVEGFQAGPDTDTTASINEVAPAFFSTLGIPLLAGRDFARTDGAGAPKVAIVNEAFAAKFGLSNPVGKHLGVGSGADTLDIEIVGFVKNAKYSEVKRPVPPQLFTPYRQDPRADSLVFYAETSGPTGPVLSAIRPMMQRIDNTLPVGNLTLLDTLVQANVFEDRVVGTVAAAFAVLATILAAIGLYGVLAYSVAQRTREIGLRMALGADRATISSMVLRSVARMTAMGGAIGLALALLAGWSVRSQLYGLTNLDPVVFASAITILALVAFGAGLIPARRASRVDPMLALRYE